MIYQHHSILTGDARLIAELPVQFEMSMLEYAGCNTTHNISGMCSISYHLDIIRYTYRYHTQTYVVGTSATVD